MIKIEIPEEKLEEIKQKHLLFCLCVIQPKIKFDENSQTPENQYLRELNRCFPEFVKLEPSCVSRLHTILNYPTLNFSVFKNCTSTEEAKVLKNKIVGWFYGSFSKPQTEYKLSTYSKIEKARANTGGADLRDEVTKMAYLSRLEAVLVETSEEFSFLKDDIQPWLNKIRLLKKDVERDHREVSALKGKVADELFNNGNDISLTWGAYPLAQALDVRTCPYCNRHYTSVYFDGEGDETKKEDRNGKTRPQLDHFLPSSLYPHLSVTLFNLVPSCYVCNSNFKSDADEKEMLNPYVAGFGDDATFMVSDENLLKKLVDGSADIKIEFDYSQCRDELIEQIQENVRVFNLKDIYDENHEDFVEELLWKEQVYTESFLEEIATNYSVFEGEDREHNLKRLLLGVYPHQYEYHKRPLSKFVTDIANQLGVLDGPKDLKIPLPEPTE